MESYKALNMANMLLGVGILLLIVPIGFSIITLTTAPDNQGPAEAFIAFGWICLVVMSLLPVGLGAFIGGLGWMVVVKRKMKAEDIEADDEKESAES